MSRQPTDIEVAERREITQRFATFDLSDEQRTAMEQVRAITRDYVANLAQFVPSSRERSAALTSIEEGKYWANQAIAKNGPSDIDWTGVEL